MPCNSDELFLFLKERFIHFYFIYIGVLFECMSVNHA